MRMGTRTWSKPARRTERKSEAEIVQPHAPSLGASMALPKLMPRRSTAVAFVLAIARLEISIASAFVAGPIIASMTAATRTRMDVDIRGFDQPHAGEGCGIHERIYECSASRFLDRRPPLS